jgi:hypothetical protein
MTRRSFIRVLLSLLLMMSQQMAISHAMTHWGGSLERGGAQLKAGGADRDSGVSSAFAQDQSCQQCLAFAQIASAVGSSARCFSAGQAASCPPLQSLSQPGCARTVCAFRSRAPPSFA